MKKIPLLIIMLLAILTLSGCNNEPVDKEFILRFDTLGGNHIASRTVLYGEGTTILPIPSKEGYTFIGWYDNESFSGDSISEIDNDLDENITVYAKWEIQQFTVTFDTSNGTTLTPIVLNYNNIVSYPDNPIKDGYTFIGWYTESEYVTLYDFTTPLIEDITLYAKWDINQYRITFNTNGGSTLDSITLNYDGNISEVDDPTKEGYIFSGWYQDSVFTLPYDGSSVLTEDITLYAKWDEIDWTDVELYLSDLLPSNLSDSISLPTTYLDYLISWSTDKPEVLNDVGIYNRPYQQTTVSLSALIQIGQHAITKVYTMDTNSYKSLSAPLTSSYIYRDYDEVDDSFFTTLDIINCAFITADSNGALTGTNVLNNINTYIMPKAKENGNWVLFSIAPDSDWSDIAISPTKINTFADNIVDMINLYGFDGVDIDWETPTSSEATLFTDMMSVIYTKVKANNPNHLVTAAIAGGMWQPPRYDLENSHQYIDYINMMTYGMVSNNGYYQNALSRSTTFDNSANVAGKTLTSCSIEESVAIYNTYGIPNSKIIAGVAFYGIEQTRTYDSVTSTWSAWVREGSVSYTQIHNVYLNSSSYDYHYDENAGVPYIIKTDGTLFVSFDNPQSIAEKSAYIITNGLAGMMYWENGLDLTGTLLEAMNTGLND